MAALTSPQIVVPPTIPGNLDPDRTRGLRDDVAQWVNRFDVRNGRDWTTSFVLPAHSSFADLIRWGSELYGRVMDGKLVSDRYLQKLVYNPAFSSSIPESQLVALCSKPRGGSNRSFSEQRRYFERFGRAIAATPEVVAGFVAYHLAASIPELDEKIRVQTAELSGRTLFGTHRAGSEESRTSFAPSGVFRTSARTLIYNSMEGLDEHDLPRQASGPELFVIERLSSSFK